MTFVAFGPVVALGAPTFVSFSLDLVVAALLGGAIGLQRQASHKPAGFRTHLLVALGSCAFMEISRLAGDSRIAANVITGIGFLGAGAFVREGNVPRGLTTAASIWAAAAVGMALGFGTPAAYALGATTTVLVFLALSFTDQRLRAIIPMRDDVDVAVTFDLNVLDFETVLAIFSRDGVVAKGSDQVSIDASGPVACWHIALRAPHRATLRKSLIRAAQTPGVRHLEAAPLAQA